MNKETQKLVGYIVYDIWTFKVGYDKNPVELELRTIDPDVHWKKKIYTTYTAAQNAIKDIMGSSGLHKAVIVPIYADRDDLNKVNDEWKELKITINKLNKNNEV